MQDETVIKQSDLQVVLRKEGLSWRVQFVPELYV